MSAPPELARLAEHVGTAVTLAPEAMGRAILAALREATAKTGWLPPERRRVTHDNYARHLVYADPADRFSILAIVWDRGQMSPIHGHQCWCAVGVYQGLLTETHYREGTAEVPPVEIGSARHAVGEAIFDAGAGIHRIGNFSSALAVSLHVYGVARDRISTGVNRVFSVSRER
jgi:predicted metal-dependent enzyme (double-stranded beta helix superfamily)